MDSIDLIRIATAVLALLVAIIGHEIMHGWVAYKYGDMTAKNPHRPYRFTACTGDDVFSTYAFWC